MSAWDDYHDPADIFDHDGSGSEEIELRFDSLGRETAEAWLVRFELAKNLEWVEYWLPKSQTQICHTTNTIWVPRWLVDQHDLEKYEV